jgi:hypothetical protein
MIRFSCANSSVVDITVQVVNKSSFGNLDWKRRGGK